MWTDFVEKIQTAHQHRKTHIVLRFDPVFEQLPLPITRHDDPFFPFGKDLITATRNIVCAYMFDLAAYLAMGAAGARALERTIRFVGNDTATILHGAFVGTTYSAMADQTALGVDALTLSRIDDLEHYLTAPPYAAFVTQIGSFDLDTLPQQGGYYWEDEGIMGLRTTDGEALRLQVTTDNVLYASRLDDYADATRDAIQELLA